MSPDIVPPDAANPERIAGFNPNFKLPYTLQWNVALQQGLGSQQSLSLSYVGSLGRRLIQTQVANAPNPVISLLELVENSATSNYNALQLQLQRRLASRLQLVANYTWSHSIDTASGGSSGVASNISPDPATGKGNRGNSDFDIRHSLSAAVTYGLPKLNINPFLKATTNGWSLQSVVQAQTARPVPILVGNLSRLANGASPDIRPDFVPGIPLYLYGSQYPGGKGINDTIASSACPDGSDRIGPFCPPPTVTASNGDTVALRQGALGRNVVRGFGLLQWDFGVHREFLLKESLRLQFRAELFNVLNHPNFAPPLGDIDAAPGFFGRSQAMLGQYLAGQNLGAGGLSSLYQTGGPRSVQLALKLIF